MNPPHRCHRRPDARIAPGAREAFQLADLGDIHFAGPQPTRTSASPIVSHSAYRCASSTSVARYRALISACASGIGIGTRTGKASWLACRMDTVCAELGNRYRASLRSPVTCRFAARGAAQGLCQASRWPLWGDCVLPPGNVRDAISAGDISTTPPHRPVEGRVRVVRGRPFRVGCSRGRQRRTVNGPPPGEWPDGCRGMNRCPVRYRGRRIALATGGIHASVGSTGARLRRCGGADRYASDDCRETERVHERTSLGLRGCGVTSRNVVDRLSR